MEKSISTPSFLHVFLAAGAAFALHFITPLPPRKSVSLPVFVSKTGFSATIKKEYSFKNIDDNCFI